MNCVSCNQHIASFRCVCGDAFCNNCAEIEQHENQTQECDRCHKNICTSYFDQQKYPNTCWKCYCQSQLTGILENSPFADPNIKEQFSNAIGQILENQPDPK